MAEICLAVAVLFSVAYGGAVKTAAPPAEPASTPTIQPMPTPQPNSNSPIRKIGFRNFRYTGPDDFAETFTLKEGERPFVQRKESGISLDEVQYADLTGDGQEEAILTMGIQTGGSSMPGLVFIYTTVNDKPKCLWKFTTGDRADGGLKQIRGEDGKLIVELYGQTTLINGYWKNTTPDEKRCGDGCKNLYTLSKVKWTGKAFLVSEDPEFFI